MRKLMMVVALVVVLVPLAAVASLAATGQLIQCRNVLPCTGGSGDDRVLANHYTNDTDLVKRGGGSDRINVADGDTLDTANGGKSRDLCIVDSKKEVGASCDATIEVSPNP